MKVSDKTKSALTDFASTLLDRESSSSANGQALRNDITNILKLVGATPEFQRA